ncbi:MAG TPA: nuclear transport factor 2 family protein [Lunatimonas sp.]|nr:nuclear transport factor 2 family protein [Lunatimonas sp.]
MTPLALRSKSGQNLSISELAQAFSLGEFEEVYPYLSVQIIWIVVGENEFEGKEAVIENCKQVRQYFDSVTTEFKTNLVITDGNKVVVTGTAKFFRNGKQVSFIPACDVYEFDDRQQIEKITSYCIQNPQ